MEDELQDRGLAMQAMLAEFDTCATEIQNRSDRQNLLVNINLTALGLIAATILVDGADISLLLVAAVLAPILGLAWLDHATVITGLGKYIASEIEPFISMGLLKRPNLLHWEQGYTVRSSRIEQDQATQNYGIPNRVIFLIPAILAVGLYGYVRGKEVFTEFTGQTYHCSIEVESSLMGEALTLIRGTQYTSCDWEWYALRFIGFLVCGYAIHLSVFRFWRKYTRWDKDNQNRRQDVDFTLARRFITSIYRSGIYTEEVPWYFRADKPGHTTEEYYVMLREAAQSKRKKLEIESYSVSPFMELINDQEASRQHLFERARGWLSKPALERDPGWLRKNAFAGDPGWLKNTDDWDGVEPRTVRFWLWFVGNNEVMLSDPSAIMVSMKVQYGTIVQIDQQAVPLEE